MIFFNAKLQMVRIEQHGKNDLGFESSIDSSSLVAILSFPELFISIFFFLHGEIPIWEIIREFAKEKKRVTVINRRDL